MRNIPQCIYIDRTSSQVYLGTSSGLFKSEDYGKTWQKLHFLGLDSLDIRRIEKGNSKLLNSLYLATDKGFYELSLKERSLKNLYSGLLSQDIRDFSSGKKSLFIVTSKGLYKYSQEDEDTLASEKNYPEEYLKYEPSYQEVAEASLRFNNLHPDIIKNWKKRIKLRALLPTLSLDYDKTIYGTSGGATYDGKAFVGPRDWGLSLSWDMGDLIWNSYEDDIDTRSRLDTQSRIEILDDVRRIYFERKKVELELKRNPPEDEDKLIEKQLYLEELTAALDGYTGGYFSKRLKELKEKVRK